MPARHARRRPRGSALVLSVLIMIAMLGLGLLAMRSTTQNIAGSGALRMNKTAQFVAEVGLYHAMTMMRGEAENLLLLRRPFPDSMLEIDSTGPLRVRLADGNVGPGQNRPPPPLLSAGPDALGELSASGLVASYRVVIEGFTLVQAAQVAGEEIGGGGGDGEGFCMVHFTSTGYVADRPIPSAADLLGADAETRFAEHRVKAAVPLRVNDRSLCRQF
ncbi:MAG: pilus assembly PilX N-terminal domain-containing protein [bacterium]